MTTSAGKALVLVALSCLFVAVVLAPSTFYAARSDSQVVVTLTGPTMGTRYSVLFVANGSFRETDSSAIKKLIDERLQSINRQMSTYDPESELSRFNRHEMGTWLQVSEETATVAAFAKVVAVRTAGAFDPTVAPAVNLWGFGPEGRRTAPPGDVEIDAVRQRIGHDLFDVHKRERALRKRAPNLQLDLSAIAKGYAVDAIGELIWSEGFQSYMVEIGGEVITRGRKPNGQPWRIGIEKPDSFGRVVKYIVELADAALATSGDYRNAFDFQGLRYSHTIDPVTARPVSHKLAAVSVSTPTCMEADALATALLVMGPQRGYNWAEAEGIAALFIARGDDGVREMRTSAWRDAFPAMRAAAGQN